jgi:hypothetical protein
MTDNPFDAPGTDVLARAPGIESALRGTRWAVLVVGGFFALVSAMMVCGGIAMFGIAAIGTAGSPSSEMGPGLMVGLGVVYIVIAIVYLAPTWLLIGYGRDIGAYLGTPTTERLVVALERQRKFWVLAAVLMCSMIVLYAVVVAALVIAGVATGAS